MNTKPGFITMWLMGVGMIYVGIDPGKLGGIAMIQENGTLVDIQPMPRWVTNSKKEIADFKELQVMLSPYLGAQIWVEAVGPIPGSGSQSAFSFGQNVQVVHDVLLSLEFPYQTVRPQDWKAEVLRGTDKSKQAAINLFRQRNPSRDIGTHDGMAEAWCIAEYGRRQK